MSKWKEKYLHEIVDIRVSNVDKKIYSNKSLVKLCNYMDAYSNDYITSKISFSTGSADKNEMLRFGLIPDDVIITKDSETPDDIAISAVVIEEIENLVCGYHLAILRPDKEQVDGRFLMFKLKDNDLKSYFGRAAKGSTRFGLTIGDIEKAPVTIPSLPVQRKISTILSTCDSVIEKTQAAIAKYKAIKQGMLHDLFTRGIDLQTGKLRPKYEDAPEMYKESKLGWIPKEWEEDRLGSKAVIEYGKSQKEVVSLNGTIPVYGTGGIMEYATEFLFEGESILIGRKGTIDKPIYITGKFWTVDTAYYLSSFVGNIRWLHYQLECFGLKRLNEATGVPSIN